MSGVIASVLLMSPETQQVLAKYSRYFMRYYFTYNPIHIPHVPGLTDQSDLILGLFVETKRELIRYLYRRELSVF